MACGPRATITHGDARESIASRGSGTTVAWSWPSTLRRTDPTSTWGLPAKRDGPPQRARPTKRLLGDESNWDEGQHRSASGGLALHRALTAWPRLDEPMPQRPIPLRPLPIQRSEKRWPACGSLRDCFALASDRDGAERSRSADRSQETIHTAGLHRDSAASLGSACSGFHSRLCHTAASRLPWTTANTSRRSSWTR
jgi:hypothetical protein